MAKSLVDQTEALLLFLHEKARPKKFKGLPIEVAPPEMDLAAQLKLVAASTAFLAAKAKLVPEQPEASGLAALRDALMEDDKPKSNGKDEPEPPKPEVFAPY